MRRLLWDTTLEPCEYPQIIKDIFFKESVKNRLAYTSWAVSYTHLRAHET